VQARTGDAMEDLSFSTLSSQRLTVRRFRADDAEPFAAYRSDPDVARYQGWEAPYSLANAARLIESLQGAVPGAAGEGFQFAVTLTATGLLIGDCYLHPACLDPGEAELGFTFAKAHQGRGYASEAVRCLLQYAFASLSLHRVFAVTYVQNKAARRLLERAGFRCEGPFNEKASRVESDNELIYGLLQEDWRRRHAS